MLHPMSVTGSGGMAAQQNIRAAQQKFRARRTWEGANYVAHHIAPTTVVIMRMGVTAASTMVVIIQMKATAMLFLLRFLSVFLVEF